jgi:enoyl-CoA hydratase/3-hydroxyacyl-CoA dehydrogenase
VIGAGTIGPDIGYYLKSSLPDSALYLVDIVEKPLKDAQERIEGYIQKAIEKRKMTEEKSRAVGTNIHYTMDYGEIKRADLVIEAATENLEIKRKIFAQVEEIVGPETIITSNTSSIPAERIFSGVKRPERTTVTHFFAPAWRNPAVEVITWEKVDRKIVDYLAWMFCSTGKMPIISKSEICFILDRVFDNWCNDAGMLLDTATASQIDKVAEEFVYAGPFSVLNLARGNPIIVETNTLQMEEGQHYRPAKIFHSVESWVATSPGGKVAVPDDIRERVRERLLGVLFSQCFDIINRGIGIPQDLNLGCQIALGFRKGPFDIMRDLGEGETKRIIDQFQKDRPGMPGPKGEISAYQDFKRHILVDHMNGVRIITIRRPQFMNALNDEVNDEILGVLEDGQDDPTVKGFVITGYKGLLRGGRDREVSPTIGRCRGIDSVFEGLFQAAAFYRWDAKTRRCSYQWHGPGGRGGAGHALSPACGYPKCLLSISRGHPGNFARDRWYGCPLSEMARLGQGFSRYDPVWNSIIRRKGHGDGSCCPNG